jgi:hypothetical protein
VIFNHAVKLNQQFRKKFKSGEYEGSHRLYAYLASGGENLASLLDRHPFVRYLGETADSAEKRAESERQKTHR